MNWKTIATIIVLIGLSTYAIMDFQSGNEEDVTLPESGGGTSESTTPSDIDSQPVSGNGVGIQAGYKAPDFELETLDGETAKLSDYKGKRILLNLWASWCPPCRAEMPDIQDLYTKYKGDDFIVIGVNLTTSEQNIDNVKKFVDEYDLTFPTFMDVENKVGKTYQAISIPTSVFIDSNGIIRKRIVGSMDRETIEENIEKLK